MLQRVLQVHQTEAALDVSVVERTDAPGMWSVEAIETDGDGACYQAFFLGPEAEQRAREYAAFKYAS